VLRKLWNYGGAARLGVLAWLVSLVVAGAVGLLIGMATDHRLTDRGVYGMAAAVLVGIAIVLIALGSYLTYRGTGGYPKGWAADH
jgi:hypothetical protein